MQIYWIMEQKLTFSRKTCSLQTDWGYHRAGHTSDYCLLICLNGNNLKPLVFEKRKYTWCIFQTVLHRRGKAGACLLLIQMTAIFSGTVHTNTVQIWGWESKPSCLFPWQGDSLRSESKHHSQDQRMCVLQLPLHQNFTSLLPFLSFHLPPHILYYLIFIRSSKVRKNRALNLLGGHTGQSQFYFPTPT